VLRRRPYLGLDLEGPPVPGGGVRIQSVRAGSPAERAGLGPGDVVVVVVGRPVSEPGDVAHATRGATGDAVSMVVARDGVTREVHISAEPMPVESIEEGRVVLGEVRVGAHALRTIHTIPRGTLPFPAILYLQGIDTGSCEHALEPDHPVRKLVSSWAGCGFVAMRVERSGVGDSEGPPPSECGLEMEIATANAALEALLSHDLVDAERVVVFGSSLGGMIAPLCPSVSRARGIAVFGTSSKRWRACAVATTERQLVLRGYEGAELAERLALWAEMHAAVCRDGRSPAEAMAERAHLGALASRECRGDTLFGRPSAFFRALDATDLRAAWRAFDRDVLVIRGEYDWVCDADDATSVVDACGPRRARLVDLPGIGHDMRAHTSLEVSFREPTRGRWDGAVAAVTAEWMRALTS
jgi:pimeloyl-ACP methyl ester carboxylesterase